LFLSIISALINRGRVVFRKNDLIDVTQFCGLERAGEVASIIINQLLSSGFRVFSFSKLLSEDDIDGDFSGGVGIIDVAPMMLAAHDVIGTAVGLPGYHRDFRYGGFTVGINDFGSVLDDATVFLAKARYARGAELWPLRTVTFPIMVFLKVFFQKIDAKQQNKRVVNLPQKRDKIGKDVNGAEDIDDGQNKDSNGSERNIAIFPFPVIFY